MKILHFADLHIGYENYGKVDDKTGLNSRLLDFLKAFDKIIDYALTHKIGLVIFAGDAYKTRDPSPTYQREFSKRLKKLASKIPTVLITGNHDIPPSYGKADTLEIFPILEVPNVYVFSKPEIRDINGVQIVALPWILKSSALKEDERKKSIEKVREILSGRISEIFKELVSKIKPAKPAIAVVHQSVTGAVFASSQDTYIGNDPLISAQTLANPKISYVALGHLHKYQVLNEDPPVIYSGSIERIDFGEESEEKGFVVADINPGQKTKWQFIQLAARKFKTINIQVPEKENKPSDFVKKEIKKADIKDAVVRIVIHGREEMLARILESDIREATKSASYIASVSKKSEKKVVKIEINSEDYTPMDWLSKYLEYKQFKKDQSKLIKETAQQLMEELT